MSDYAGSRAEFVAMLEVERRAAETRRWWGLTWEERTAESRAEATCWECGANLFDAGRDSRATYCSDACKMRAYRRRKRYGQRRRGRSVTDEGAS